MFKPKAKHFFLCYKTNLSLIACIFLIFFVPLRKIGLYVIRFDTININRYLYAFFK